MSNKKGFKAGFVGIIGKPNVGKSALLNELIGYKVSVITRKPQTTRNKLLGVANYDNFQIALFDTPGMHRPEDTLGKFMVEEIKRAISDSEVLIFMADASSGFRKEDKLLLDCLEDCEKPVIFVLNKIDLINKRRILPLLDGARKKYEFREFVPVSVKTKVNLDTLVSCIEKFLPPSEKLFPNEIITNSPEHFVISEIIRKELLKYTHQEIPYSAAVVVKEISERKKKNLIYIKAIIYVERESQKKIVIGHEGSKVKQVGKNARIELEEFLDKKVFLDLKVEVFPHWKKEKKALKKMGYNNK